MGEPVNSWRAFVEVKNKGSNLSLQVSGLLTLCFSSSTSGSFNLLQPLALHVMCILWLRLHFPGTAQSLKWNLYMMIFFGGCRRTSPKVWSVEVGPALDVSRDLHKSSGWHVAQLWLQCGTEGHVPVWGWESCVLLLALCWPPLWSWAGHSPPWTWVSSLETEGAEMDDCHSERLQGLFENVL